MSRNIYKYIAVLLLAFGFSKAVLAQSFQVKLNADTVLIGDIFSISFDVDGFKDSKVFFPEYSDSIGQFEIVEIFPEDTTKTGFSKKWDITIYEPGAYELVGFKVLLQNKNGEIDTLSSQSVVNLFVNTIPVDTAKAFMPIKPAKNIPYPYKEVFKKYVLYVVIILAIIAAIILFFWYRNKRKNTQAKKITPLDAHSKALQNLKEIEIQKLWQKDKTKEYYLAISEVLRVYLENRFYVNALETTTDEILDNMKLANDNTSLNHKLKELLQQCDLAKFAKFKPVPEENTRLMKAAQDFVLHTKPKPVTEESKTIVK